MPTNVHKKQGGKKYFYLVLSIILVGFFASSLYSIVKTNRSWIIASQFIKSQELRTVLDDQVLNSDDLTAIISHTKSFSYDESHLTNNNCDPDVYNCDNIVLPTEDESVDSYYKIGQPASEYRYISEKDFFEFLSFLILENNYRYFGFINNTDKSLVDIMFFNQKGTTNNQNAISLQINTDSNLIESILIGDKEPF